MTDKAHIDEPAIVGEGGPVLASTSEPLEEEPESAPAAPARNMTTAADFAVGDVIVRHSAPRITSKLEDEAGITFKLDDGSTLGPLAPDDTVEAG